VEIAIAVIGALVALGWLPVFHHFWRSWRKRRNPISLAICGLIGFMVYINVAIYIFLDNDPLWTASVVGGVNIVVLLNFYACFRWAEKLFPGHQEGKRPSDEESWKLAIHRSDES
jgi:hypothetical protein